MKHLIGNKTFIIALGIFSLMLLVFLAAGLESLVFNKGTPFTFVEANDSNAAEAIEPPRLDWIITPFIAFFFILIIFVFIFATPKQRRRLLLLLLTMAVILLVIMWWISQDGSGGKTPQTTATIVHTPQVFQETDLPIGTLPSPVEYTAPRISPWISIGITFSVLIVAVVLVWFFIRHRFRDNVSLETLAGIAEQTVSDLQSGRDYGDAIINCYASMIRSVSKLRGIRRRGNLTPEEFIAVLERARLPSEPVHRLTVLFERVRYGGKVASQTEIDDAVACMTEIVSAIREVQ